MCIDGGRCRYRTSEVRSDVGVAEQSADTKMVHRCQVRLQLFALSYNIGNFLRRLALPKRVKQWSLRTLRVKLIKIGAKVVKHARYVTFQMAEVMVSKRLFQEILERIHRLKPVPIGYG